MFGYARIITTEYAIYVRFERVGNYQQFNAVMDRFNQSFPLKMWHGQKRAWQLAPDELNDLVEFCRATFGITSYMLQKESITELSHRQAGLEFINSHHTLA